jgi:hypothetical protein
MHPDNIARLAQEKPKHMLVNNNNSENDLIKNKIENENDQVEEN